MRVALTTCFLCVPCGHNNLRALKRVLHLCGKIYSITPKNFVISTTADLWLTKICKKRITAILFSLIYAFTTSVWSITSRGIWQHGPSLLFITISLSILFSKKENLIPYSGFFLGMAVFNRPTNMLIALPLTIYVFLYHKIYIKKYVIKHEYPF